MSSVLHELVPVVESEAVHDPLADLPSCQEILLNEGFSEHQVHEWVRHTISLSAKTLRLLVDQRKN